MKINLEKIKVRNLYQGYQDAGEDGVVGYDGKLDIRPPYQREFIYKDKQRDAVIETVRHGFPLNVMYWGVNVNGHEVMDGQQRTLSICQYIHNDFSMNNKYFHNLTQEEQDQILDYEIMVYFCEGSEREKLNWFKIINIAGEKLTEQELRNAVYTGQWLADAKLYFSKKNGPAYNKAKDYLSGVVERQDYLETALKWISDHDMGCMNIEGYMALHQHDQNASAMRRYFASVIDWIETYFPHKRREMKSVDWGILFNEHKDGFFDAKKLEIEVSRLMQDEDVTKKPGIYAYLITGDEHHLSLRAFTPNQKRETYERQGGLCAIIGLPYPIEEMEADHIISWSQGGKTLPENCQMVSKLANRRKSNS